MARTMQRSSLPSSSFARGAIFMPPPYAGALAIAARIVGLNDSTALPFDEILIGKGAKRRNSRGAERAYPPCARTHLGRLLARLAISPSRPIPATQQKYCGADGSRAG